MMVNLENNNLILKPLDRIGYCRKCGSLLQVEENDLMLCSKCKNPTEERTYLKIRDLSGNQSGKRLILKGRIIAEGQTKTIPVRLTATCNFCALQVEVNLEAEEYKETLQKLFFVNKEKIHQIIKSSLPKTSCKARSGHEWILTDEEYLDFRICKIQDLIEFEEAQEREQESKSITGILLEKTDVKLGFLDCEVLIAPDNSLMLLIYKVIPLELEGSSIKPEEMELIKRYFQGKTVEELKPVIDRIVAPQVRGRLMAKVAAALTALTPKWITLRYQEPIPSSGRTIFVGDARTGKGFILRWFWKNGIANHAVGETSSRTGLTYNVDPELRVISWGILPRSDGRMVCIEGLHGLSSEEMSRFREALAQQRVEVHRLVEGSAWCRTRILADLNPRQPSLSGNYPFVGLALLDCKPFSDPIDLTRWDLFIPFKAEDVPVDEMYGEFPTASREEEQAFISLIKFAWSLRSSDIHITDKALEKARELFKEVLETYGCDQLPIIHNASFWTLLRLSTAVAILEFSTEDGKTITVTEKHVEEACKFYRETLEALQLREIKAMMMEKPLTEEEAKKIKTELDEEALQLFFEIVKKPGDVAELAGRLGVSEKTIKRRASELKTYGLITRGERGYKPTKRGIAFFKFLIKNDLIDPFDPAFSERQKETKEDSAKTRGQKGQLIGFYKDNGICELCGKTVYGYCKVLLDGKTAIVCDECLKELKGEDF